MSTQAKAAKITKKGAQARADFKVKNWDEKPYNEIDGGPKLTRASVTQSIEGDIHGVGATEFLMAYRTDESASFIGLQRIVGRIGNRSGSFVLEGKGTYEDGTAKATWSIVPGSGTEELRGLRGEGEFIAHRGPNGSLALDYDFE
jgi:hypothetical protein